MLLEERRRPLDHLLVDSALSETEGVGDSFGARASMCDDDGLPDAELRTRIEVFNRCLSRTFAQEG